MYSFCLFCFVSLGFCWHCLWKPINIKNNFSHFSFFFLNLVVGSFSFLLIQIFCCCCCCTYFIHQIFQLKPWLKVDIVGVIKIYFFFYKRRRSRFLFCTKIYFCIFTLLFLYHFPRSLCKWFLENLLQKIFFLLFFELWKCLFS